MADIFITSKNVDKVVKAFNKLPKELLLEIQKTIQQSGVFTVGEVKSHITKGTEMYRPPVLTGAMRRGIHIAEKKPMEVVIRPSSSTPYARFVHEGTRGMQGRPFFDITARRSKKKITTFFANAVDKAINKIF